ncbi:hypothetical protein [Membranihabitans maritimus]|uniref:hypothetical protein n=1 Tax=Membranihabitans maritimus TaxID=2904244 RepID=UPI001F20BFC9|nr:hypothetical protein [Membranihabitans maritimus]
MVRIVKKCSVLLGLCSLVISCYSQSGVTLYAGPTFTNFDLSNNYLNPTFQMGYRTGLDVRIGDDTFWMLFGGSYNETYFGDHTYFRNIFSDTQDKIQFAGVKFNLEKRFFPNGNIRPMIAGGVLADYLLDFGKNVTRELGTINTLTAYWNASAGVQLQSLFVRFSYERGIKEYFEDHKNTHPARIVCTLGFFF